MVRDGHEIVVDPAPGAEERTLRLFILGPALALLLHQRGRLILHASAVEIDGDAVAFLGGPRWGKSTTAGALHVRGHPLVADDVVAVQPDTNAPVVFPGFPRLKLWPEAARSLGDDPEALPQLHPRFAKRDRPATEGFVHDLLPLRRVYVLAEDSHQAIQPLSPQEALIELVRHSFVAGWLASTGAAASHFRQCSNLVNQVLVCRLERPRSLAELPDLARLIERDVAQATG